MNRAIVRRRRSPRRNRYRSRRDTLGVFPPPHPGPSNDRRPADSPGSGFRPVRGVVCDRSGKRRNALARCAVPDRAGRLRREPGTGGTRSGDSNESPELVRQFVFDDRDYRVLVCAAGGLSRSPGELAAVDALDHREPDALDPHERHAGPRGGHQSGWPILSHRKWVGRSSGSSPASDPGMRMPEAASVPYDGLRTSRSSRRSSALVCRELNNRRVASGLDADHGRPAGRQPRAHLAGFLRAVRGRPAAGSTRLCRRRAGDRFRTPREHRTGTARRSLTRRGAVASAHRRIWSSADCFTWKTGWISSAWSSRMTC